MIETILINFIADLQKEGGHPPLKINLGSELYVKFLKELGVLDIPNVRLRITNVELCGVSITEGAPPAMSATKLAEALER